MAVTNAPPKPARPQPPPEETPFFCREHIVPLDGLRGSDGSVTMPVDGVVLSVLAQSGEEIAKDQPMATYCEKQDMQLVCPADEEDLAAIQVGM